VGQSLLVIDTSRSHIDTPHTHAVGLLWTNDQLVAETSTRQSTTLTPQETNIHVPGMIRTRNRCKLADADPGLTPRGHRDHHLLPTTKCKYTLLSCDYFEILQCEQVALLYWLSTAQHRKNTIHINACFLGFTTVQHYV